MCSVRARLPADERRNQILESVQDLMAEKGFHATTTRQLADAANVSEALLFKHFPSKEALYKAMLEYQCATKCTDWAEVAQLKPSTETLVRVVHFLMSRLVRGRESKDDHLTMDRMLLRSLCEDGAFARVALSGLKECVISKIEECLKVAARSGDLTTRKPLPLGAWFTHQLALMQRFLRIPSNPAVPYIASNDDVVQQAVVFCLRGMGLREEAITKFAANKKAKPKKRS
jgi:AcrR family transcriptional regulator